MSSASHFWADWSARDFAALQASGARIAWSAAPRVTTSARRDAKARGGFGDTLLQVVGAMTVTEAIEGLVASTTPALSV